MMDAAKIREMVLARAARLGIQRSLDPSRSQFLDMTEGPFVELVVTDGGKLGEFDGIAEAIKQQARTQGVDVDVVLRTIWKVADVEHVGTAPGATGGLRSAERFRAILRSGELSQEVMVDVTWDGFELLSSKLPELSKGVTPKSAFLKDLVMRFLDLQLSFGGVSYWDPVRYPRQDLDAAAMSYMLTHELVKTGV